MVDSCSRFLWVWPERSEDTQTVVKDLWCLVAMGAVHTFDSDNGLVFLEGFPGGHEFDEGESEIQQPI